MRNDFYPAGTIQSLIDTKLVSVQTRAALKDRLSANENTTPRFFKEKSFLTLQSVCARLLPQPADRVQKINLAGFLDEQLFEGKGNGWRYDLMPADGVAMANGLQGIDETAEMIFGSPFYFLEPVRQDELLRSVQSGICVGNVWTKLPPRLFFEELLTALTEIYYSHPFGREEIGDVSWADVNGWKQVGLNALDDHEPGSLNQV